MIMSPAQQATALAQTVGVRARDDLRVLRVQGDDQRSWLNGQVTADVRALRSGQAAYALAVNVKGRVLSDLWVLCQDDQLIVLLPEPTLATVRESFERQIIMEDVELKADELARVLSAQGPKSLEVSAAIAHAFPCDELGHGGVFVLTAAAEREATLATLIRAAEHVGGGAVDESGFELARLRAGRPRLGMDFGERAYPQEAGLKGLAVSFNKGCYIGQEVVCTLEHRGRLMRRLVRLEAIDGAIEVGDELRDAQGNVVGQITSTTFDPDLAHGLALGYAKLAHTEPGHALTSARASLVVRGLAGAD